MKIKYANLIIAFFLIFSSQVFIKSEERKNDLFANAEKYEEEGKVLEAVKCYEEYNQLNNNLEKKEKISLKIARISSEYETKVKKYREFLNQYPDSKYKFLARYELADLYKLNGDYKESIREYIKLANLSKGTIYWQKANINIASLEYKLKQYDLAIEILNDLLTKINDYEDLGTIYFLLGKIMLEQSKYKEAENFFLICAGSYPQSSKGAVSLLELQYIYILLDKYSEAERISLMLNQLYPDSLENLNAQKKLESIKVNKDKKYLEIELINLDNNNEIENKSIDKIKKDLQNSLDIFKKIDELKISNIEKAYYIQMGYFSKLDNVKEVIRLFNSKGINDVFYAKTKVSENPNKISYRILIGPFNNKEEANKRLIELKDKNIESIILELYKYYD